VKNIILLVFLGFSSVLFAQEYPFLTTSTHKIKGKEYLDYLNENPNKTDSIHKATKRFLVDGTPYNQTYSDSIFKSKEGFSYTTLMYRDTLSNQFYYVLYKRSKAEMREDNKAFNDYINKDEKNRKKLKGSAIDDLVMVDIDDNQHDLESIGNKIIVIDFWFTTCAPCIKEMPELNKLKEEYGTNNVAWFGVTYDDNEKVNRLLSKVQFDFTIVPNSQHLVDRFGIKFFPTTLIIDENRKIVYTGSFFEHNSRIEHIKAQLTKLVKAKKYSVEAGPIQTGLQE
jgi:thiol-disulfide isomerase/thioredoxin